MSKVDCSLLDSYRLRESSFFESEGFSDKGLEASRSLFEKRDRALPYFVPKALEVEACISGLPFSNRFKAWASSITDSIDEVIGDVDRFWVEPANLAVEYFVSKWPSDDPVCRRRRQELCDFIAEIFVNKFEVCFRGFQVHDDGCVILRGFDDYAIRSFREVVLGRFPWLPRKQSHWAHVPLGRILSHLDKGAVEKLRTLAVQSQKRDCFTETITSVSYVSEHQWYMENKEILFWHPLV